MLRLQMLPAAHGDALWLEYGSDAAVSRVLVDAGPASSYESLRWRILSLPPGSRHFELLVVTHVDADHIEGVIRLLQDETLGCTFGDIWFNDWTQIEQLPERPPLPPILGPLQGEFLAALIEQRPGQRWNGPWDRRAIFVAADGALPRHRLPGGLELTVLSPGLDELDALRKEWDKVVAAAGFTPGDRDAALLQLRKRRRLGPPRAVLGDESEPGTLDSSVANGSSIALLAEFGGRRLLLSGDAFAPALRRSLERWCGRAQRGAVRLDAFKLPHHGSRANVTPQILQLLDCSNYLISTSGAIFGHPDADAVDLILEHHNARGKARLHFNYRSHTTERWADPADQEARHYEAVYPQGGGVDFYAGAGR